MRCIQLGGLFDDFLVYTFQTMIMFILNN